MALNVIVNAAGAPGRRADPGFARANLATLTSTLGAHAVLISRVRALV
jgi:hypothetical protein